MSSLFVGDEDGEEEYTLYDNRDESIIVQNPIVSEEENKDDSKSEPSIPINVQEDSNTAIYQTREICLFVAIEVSSRNSRGHVIERWTFDSR